MLIYDVEQLSVANHFYNSCNFQTTLSNINSANFLSLCVLTVLKSTLATLLTASTPKFTFISLAMGMNTIYYSIENKISYQYQLVNNTREHIMFVCLCNAITDRQIKETVAAGANSLTDLQAQLGVATCCGCCADLACSYLNVTAEAQLSISSGIKVEC